MIGNMEYKREMNRNYMVFRPDLETCDKYTIQMISGNKIPGLLEFQEKKTNGVSSYYYDITSKQPLRRILEYRSLTAKELQTLISDFLYTLRQLERFLLDENQICMDPDRIYIEPDTFRGYFCLIPGVQYHFPEEFFNLTQYLLDRVDHNDGEAVVLAFSIFRACKKENFGIHDIEVCLDYRDQEKENLKTKDIGDEKIVIKERIIKQDEEKGKNVEPEKEKQKESVISNGQYNWFMIGIGICSMILIPLLIVLLFNLQVLIEWKWYIGAVEIILVVLMGVTVRHPKYSEEYVQDEDEFEMWEQTLFNESDINAEEEKQDSDGDMQTILLTPKTIREERGERTLISSDGNIKIQMGYFPFLIGKSKSMSDFCLNEPGISRLHVKFEHKNGLYYITDLNSTNGTEVNGVLLEANETKRINLGDELSIADIKFVFR